MWCCGAQAWAAHTRLHALLRPHLEAQGAPVFDSYLKVWLAALRAGPTYTEQDHFLRPPGRGL